jgi:hypothetical protein
MSDHGARKTGRNAPHLKKAHADAQTFLDDRFRRFPSPQNADSVSPV